IALVKKGRLNFLYAAVREATDATTIEWLTDRLRMGAGATGGGASRAPAGAGREGGLSLARIQQRARDGVAGLFPARSRLELPHPLARSDQRAGRGRRERGSGAGRGADPGSAGDKRSGEFHRLFEKNIHPQVDQYGRNALPEHRHRAPEAKASWSYAG